MCLQEAGTGTSQGFAWLWAQKWNLFLDFYQITSLTFSTPGIFIKWPNHSRFFKVGQTTESSPICQEKILAKVIQVK